jgi:hypothetical protein
VYGTTSTASRSGSDWQWTQDIRDGIRPARRSPCGRTARIGAAPGDHGRDRRCGQCTARPSICRQPACFRGRTAEVCARGLGREIRRDLVLRTTPVRTAKRDGSESGVRTIGETRRPRSIRPLHGARGERTGPALASDPIAISHTLCNWQKVRFQAVRNPPAPSVTVGFSPLVA